MKKLSLLALAASVTLVGCANDPAANGKSEIFGKVTVIDETGRNLTEFCTSKTMTQEGLLKQKAIPGVNQLGYILCSTGHYMYRIDPAADVTVNVPSDNVAVYFGDITLTLSKEGYTIKNQGYSSKGLYNGILPVKEGKLTVGPSEKNWMRTYTGTTQIGM